MFYLIFLPFCVFSYFVKKSKGFSPEKKSIFSLSTCIILGIQRWLLLNCKLNKNGICFHLDPKEEKEEEDDSALPQEVSIAAARPSRGWRSSSSRTSVSRHRDTETTRSSRSKTGSLQLICKSEPNTDPLDYGTVQVECDYFKSQGPIDFTRTAEHFPKQLDFQGRAGVVV